MSRQDGQIESRERCWGAETHLGQCLFTFWVSMQAQKDYNESQRLSWQKMHGFNSLRILSGKKICVQFLGVQCLCLVVISFTCPRIVRKQSAWRKVSLCFISIIKNQCRSFSEEANLGSNFIKRWGMKMQSCHIVWLTSFSLWRQCPLYGRIEKTCRYNDCRNVEDYN